MDVREVIVESYREGFSPVVASAIGGLLAGVILGSMQDQLSALPGLLVLVPALLATRGNVYGAFASRIASGLHQGLVEPRIRPDERLRAAAVAAMSNNLLASGIAAVLTVAILRMLGRPVAGLPTLVGIAVLAAFLAGLALSVVVVVVMMLGYRRGIDPDTLVGPLVTTTGDVIGISFLLVAVDLALALGGT
ncbi:magnesium transporter [Halanaeroarchaeum sulfurireducens]|uniref:Divalent cation transporter subunit I, MgtE family protein n=1 Tax=Halanaeroarchaeum sulfurireducens TaxID=1604004 RepID=A0A0F7PBN1_9EURY|nr:magnesium transporter [Halanaeroarchaeum sulfurireducens]AKH98581.1 divalent cation transporter subunit I, MgtE family protein [Halanaeroarchaeum sulfurireducens]